MNDEPNELAAMRQEAGITQEQVARLLEVSAKTPYNWEHLSPRRIKEWQRICYREAVRALAEREQIAGYVPRPPDPQLPFELELAS